MLMIVPGIPLFTNSLHRRAGAPPADAGDERQFSVQRFPVFHTECAWWISGKEWPRSELSEEERPWFPTVSRKRNELYAPTPAPARRRRAQRRCFASAFPSGGQPGGQASARPPRIWQWRWGTDSPAFGPLLMTNRYPP